MFARPSPAHHPAPAAAGRRQLALRGGTLQGSLAFLLMAMGLTACSTPQAPTPPPSTGLAAPESKGADQRAGIEIVGAASDVRKGLKGTIKDLSESFEETGKRSYVDDAAYEAELYLRRRGYADAEVTYEASESKATISVRTGKRFLIDDVTVTLAGESPLSRSDLSRYVNGPRTGLLGRGAMVYIESRVADAPSDIEEDLASLGYLEAEATLQVGDLPEKGGAVDIALAVVPGPRYTVGDVKFALERTAEALSDDVDLRVREAIKKTLDANLEDDKATYRPRLAGTLRGAVGEALGQNGYPDAVVVVSPAIDSTSKTASLKITLRPGPYVVLGDVEVVGEERTSASYLASRMRIERGDVYDVAKIRRSLRGLYRTGLFSQVTTSLKGEGEARSIVVEVVERPSVEIYTEPGFGSYELARATIGARDRNLFGRGIGSEIEGTLAVRAARLRLGLSDPWLFREDLLGDLRVEFNRRNEPSFVRENRGIGAFITKEWNAAQSSTFGYRFRRSEARDIEAVDADVLEIQSTVNVAGLVATQRYDRRNALFAPSSGLFAEASVEVALEGLGSELEFVRANVSAAWFAPLAEGSVFGVGLRGGVISPVLDSSTIPLQERFFAGGENSVRSFRESRLGPRDLDGEPLGGEAFGTLSLELRQELVGPLQGALFFDAGFVESDANDIFDFDDVRTGVGAGLRYLLPIGPLRVDAAFKPDKRSNEDAWVVLFAIGMPF